MDDLFCCFLDDAGKECKTPAAWEIYIQSGDPYDYTYSCDEHLPFMLDEEYENRVYAFQEYEEEK